MKNKLLALLGFILLSTVLVANAQDRYGDFLYVAEGPGCYYFPGSCTATITGYAGPGGDVTIPATLFGSVPVTAIGDYAFWGDSSLTSITIPVSVTRIGSAAFASCTSLSAITVDALNSFYSSMDGVLLNKSQTLLIQCPGGKAESYTIPNSVIRIGDYAFWGDSSLTSVTTASIGSIGNWAFYGCSSLQGVFFRGNAPSVDSSVFVGANNVTVYYLPGTTGWGATFAFRPAVLWNPLVQTGDASFGVRTNRFGFNITGTADIPIVVEACTNLTDASWVPLQSFNLANGAFYFSDPEWTNYPARNYRIRSP